MALQPHVVYLDLLALLALLSFLMDYLLLWATSKVTRVPATRTRLAAGGLLGTTYFVLYVLSLQGVVPHYGWLRLWPVLLATSVAMVLVAFYPLSWRQCVRVTGFFYFIAVSSGGAGVAAGYALGWGVLGQLAAAIAAILITSELGWGVVQKSLWQRIYHVPLAVELFGEQVEVPALVDSGNRLRDPLSGAPVVVLEHSAVSHLLPDHLRDVMWRMERGDLSEISRLLSSRRLSSRFRIIPFASLGNENGLLIGFRPDRAAVRIEGRHLELPGVLIAIAPANLDPEGTYRALIQPEMLQAALALGPHETTRNEGESAHVTSAG